MQVCKANDTYRYANVECEHAAGSFVLQKVRVNGIMGHMTFSLTQKDAQCFGPETEYKYSFARLMLLRVVDRQAMAFDCVAAVNDTQRDLHLEVEQLEPGEYYIFAELDWNLVLTDAPQFQITAYGRQQAQFLGDEHSLVTKENLLCSIMRTKVIQDHPGLTVKSMANSDLVQKYKDFNGEEGYCFIYFSNMESHATYRETCRFTAFEGLRLLPPHFGTTYEIEVPPQSEAFVLIQITDPGWTMKSSFKYTLQ